MKLIVGSVAKCRTGLGLISTNFIRKITIKEGQQLIHDEVEAGMEEKRMTKIVEFSQ